MVNKSNVFIYRGYYAFAADPHFFKCCADLVDGIELPWQFGGRMHVWKVELLYSEILHFREILLVVFESLVLYFDVDFMYPFDFKASKKTRSERLCNLAMDFCPDLLWGLAW